MDSSTTRRQFAKLGDLASKPHSGMGDKRTDDHDDILHRIRKCLDRANHPTTPEAEAKAALRVAHKLIQQHSVQQADVYADAVDSDKTAQISGQSNVHILINKERVIDGTWTGFIANAIRVFFDRDCYYTTQSSSIEWVFYRIALNTAAAAKAFEMVFNLIQEWSFQRKKGNKNTYRLGVAIGLETTAYTENDIERQQAKIEEAADLAEREEQGRLHRQHELGRLSRTVPTEQQDEMTSSTDECDAKVVEDPLMAQSEEVEPNDGRESRNSGKNYQSVKIEDESDDDPSISTIKTERTFVKEEIFSQAGSDTGNFFRGDHLWASDEEDDDNDLDLTMDLDDRVRLHIPSRPKPTSSPLPEEAPLKQFAPKDHEQTSEKSDEQTATWKSVTALTKYPNDAQKIAEDYLKDNNVDLGKGKKARLKNPGSREL